MEDFDALDYRKIKQGNAGPLGTYAILSVLPETFARFLFEFHSVRFESLDLPGNYTFFLKYFLENEIFFDNLKFFVLIF